MRERAEGTVFVNTLSGKTYILKQKFITNSENAMEFRSGVSWNAVSLEEAKLRKKGDVEGAISTSGYGSPYITVLELRTDKELELKKANIESFKISWRDIAPIEDAVDNTVGGDNPWVVAPILTGNWVLQGHGNTISGDSIRTDSPITSGYVDTINVDGGVNAATGAMSSPRVTIREADNSTLVPIPDLEF